MTSAVVVTTGTQAALSASQPVVALESALITHGFAYPDNLAITRRMAAAIREVGAVPALVAVWRGAPTVGLPEALWDDLAADRTATKVSVRDLGLAARRAVDERANGGTTVAATSILAQRAGIEVFATGGIGGVHRGHPEDVSADLPTLAQTPLVVVCAGAKSILDLPRTLEYLETWGVPVLGWGTDVFPAFYSRESGLPVDVQVDEAAEVAAIVEARRALQLPQAVLVTVPVGAEYEVPIETVAPLIDRAVAEAERAGISGKALTPYILARLVALSEAATQRANERLLVQNARVAARCAVALTGVSRG